MPVNIFNLWLGSRNISNTFKLKEYGIIKKHTILRLFL